MAKDTVILDAARLNRERLRRAWSRAELAEKAGISPLPASKAVRGEPVGLGTARSLAKAVGVPVEKLIVGEPVAAVG